MPRDHDSYYSLSDGSQSRSPHQLKAAEAADAPVAVQEQYQGGDSYEGTAVRRNGVAIKEGSGRYQFGNGSVYEGQWHKGAMHGKGVFFEAETGDRFEGQWSYGRRVKGVYYFPNGDLFIGAFDVETGNKKHGRCVLVDDLVPYDAEYHDDVLVWKEPLLTQPIAKRLALGPGAPAAANGSRATNGKTTDSARPSTARQPSAQRLIDGDAPVGQPPMDQLTAAKIVLRGNRAQTKHGASPGDMKAFTTVQRGSFERFAPLPRSDHVKEALRYYR
jgi:hypothetical protein